MYMQYKWQLRIEQRFEVIVRCNYQYWNLDYWAD